MNNDSPSIIFYDRFGLPMAVSGDVVVPVSTSALLMAGMTPTGIASVFKMQSDGTAYVVGNGSYTNILGSDRSISGENISLPYIIQTVAEFDSPFVNNDITVTQISSSTAVQTPANGAVLSSSNASGYSEVSIFGNRRNRYRPGREYRMEFSAGFPSASIANANVLIGLSDITSSLNGTTGSLSGSNPNQLVIGWIGTTFGFHVVSSGSITSISKSSWNTDLCNGTSTSNFTSNGVPVALDITKGNAYRIRGVWFGVGPVLFEVKSPDENWVTTHILRYPNTAQVPYIQSPNMFPFMNIIKYPGAGSGTLSAFAFCWDAGTVESSLGFEEYETNSHKHIQQANGGITGSYTAYTVSSGRQFLVKSLTISSFNTADSIGRLDVTDATSGSAGTILHSINLQPTTNQAGSQSTISITMPIPIIFLTGVRFLVVSGTITFAYSFQGYEKEITLGQY